MCQSSNFSNNHDQATPPATWLNESSHWRALFPCELLVCYSSNKMDVRGNGILLRQRGAWPGSQTGHFSRATELPAF